MKGIGKTLGFVFAAGLASLVGSGCPEQKSASTPIVRDLPAGTPRWVHFDESGCKEGGSGEVVVYNRFEDGRYEEAERFSCEEYGGILP